MQYNITTKITCLVDARSSISLFRPFGRGRHFFSITNENMPNIAIQINIANIPPNKYN